LYIPCIIFLRDFPVQWPVVHFWICETSFSAFFSFFIFLHMPFHSACIPWRVTWGCPWRAFAAMYSTLYWFDDGQQKDAIIPKWYEILLSITIRIVAAYYSYTGLWT
jgi:hypothetical protein